MRLFRDDLNARLLLGISIAMLFTGCAGFFGWHRTQTVTLLYTNNTNGLLEACG